MLTDKLERLVMNVDNNIKISNDVIAKIASIAACEVKGVRGLHGGNIVDGIVKTFSKLIYDKIVLFSWLRW